MLPPSGQKLHEPPQIVRTDDPAGRGSGVVTIARVCLCAAIIVGGLALRALGLRLGLPAFVVKDGGSVLWGAMVFFLVALAGSRLSRPSVALISAAIAIAVELFRLVHTPALDAFRLTLAGALLLGRIFSGWDLVAYGVGIGLAMALDGLAARLSPNNARVSFPSNR
jgi:hypothetical protein